MSKLYSSKWNLCKFVPLQSLWRNKIFKSFSDCPKLIFGMWYLISKQINHCLNIWPFAPYIQLYSMGNRVDPDQLACPCHLIRCALFPFFIRLFLTKVNSADHDQTARIWIYTVGAGINMRIYGVKGSQFEHLMLKPYIYLTFVGRVHHDQCAYPCSLIRVYTVPHFIFFSDFLKK